MKYGFLLCCITALTLISWDKADHTTIYDQAEAAAMPADTLKLNDMIFSDFVSPNGDGYNDNFIILNVENYPGNSLKIFNRWGEVIYQAQPYNNEWNGTNNRGGSMINNQVTDGIYYFEFYDGVGNNATGKITLVR